VYYAADKQSEPTSEHSTGSADEAHIFLRQEDIPQVERHFNTEYPGRKSMSVAIYQFGSNPEAGTQTILMSCSLPQFLQANVGGKKSKDIPVTGRGGL
jgi:hypothetical protein